MAPGAPKRKPEALLLPERPRSPRRIVIQGTVAPSPAQAAPAPSVSDRQREDLVDPEARDPLGGHERPVTGGEPSGHRQQTACLGAGKGATSSHAPRWRSRSGATFPRFSRSALALIMTP